MQADNARLLQDVLVTNARMVPEERRITAELQSAAYLSRDCLEALENEVCRCYGLRSADFVPHFPAETFCNVETEELKQFLIDRYPPAISSLAGSTWEIGDSKVTIRLLANGKAELEPHLPSLCSYLRERFGKTVTAEVITGVDEDGKDLFKHTQKLREQALAQLPKTETAQPSHSAGEGKTQSAVIYGGSVRGAVTPISELNLDMPRAIIEGEVFQIAHKELPRRNAWVVSFYVTDYSDSIRVSQFMEADAAKPILSGIKNGMWVRVRGKMCVDRFDNETVLQPAAIVRTEKQERMDNAPEKRVELHLHTRMSSMDALTDTAAVVKRAAAWGHIALAITDHGVVQAFPDAMRAAPKGFKILYGCEAYYYDDKKDRGAVYGDKEQPLNGEFVAFDLETTGLFAQRDAITEIGAAVFRDGKVLAEYKQFVNPGRPVPPKVTQLTGITDEMLRDAPTIDKVLPEFLAFCGDRPLAAHNAEFDIGFLRSACHACGIAFEPTYIDTLPLSQALLPQLGKHKLNIVAKALAIPEFRHHRALDDALAVGYILEKLFSVLTGKNVRTIQHINDAFAAESGHTDRRRANHMILFAKNQTGLRNLYRLVSYAHLNHFLRVPRVPRSELEQYREGLLIGSACEAGELFRAVTAGKSDEMLKKIASFYDFLEIQPLDNNRFMLEKGIAESEEQLRDFNRKIVRLGEELGKPVVATGDVHFLDPQDEIFRRILLTSKGMSDGDHPLPLYFRTTDEMLEEFAYLGEEKAYEVVVKNTNLIADMCEFLQPVPKNLFAPKLENSAEDLKSLVYGKLLTLYGEEPPKQIVDRVETEMHDIISCHYDVIYMSAQKLVANSMENGYLVGSRGSVGSSLVAYLSGITEVNSLPPHYRCPSCRYTTFDTGTSCGCGADLPDRDCPVCGARLEKDGFNIPFETFLGFGGDKVPDIDLNFSGEYQAKAHQYCVQMFGKEHVFRAGTISKVAEKTAYGYVKKYLEETEQTASKAELSRLALGCTDVKRTTGQHPGGLVVIPQENEIWDFCPVQHPADATEEDAWITTHFEYHCMESNLLKLDMLGHDDPTMLCNLGKMTGVDVQKIPLDDKDTMSIFTSSAVLGFEDDPVLGPTGAAGIPEFGTRNARRMLEETEPEEFDVLVRLSGFSHGTDVWHGNARDLVLNGVCKVNEAIGCRDDIMLYLISKGMDEKRAFKFMEAVRKGAIHKGKSWPDGIVEEMQKLGVPEWYIESCRKIQYLFPKAHAVAYVMMAFRIAWFKVHRPLEFYSAYFYRRSQKDAFDAALMTQGKERALAEIRRIEKIPEPTAKDKDLLTTLELCYEFYLRGFSFAPMDLYGSDPVRFLVRDGMLIPPFVAVGGLGETAAKDIKRARKGKKFLSIEEFSLACPKVSKAHIDALTEAGVFGDLPETSQIMLF